MKYKYFQITFQDYLRFLVTFVLINFIFLVNIYLFEFFFSSRLFNHNWKICIL